MSTDQVRLTLADQTKEFLEAAGDACRRALLAIMSAEAAAWSKKDLAAWLGGPYREATRYAKQSVDRPLETPPGVGETLPSSPDGPQPLTCGAARIEGVLREARGNVLPVVVAAPASDGTFAFIALEAGVVMQVQNEGGRFAFGPVDRPRMRLFERILSLLAADFLARPADYESKLTICRVCNCLSFDEELREVGLCQTHVPRSHRAPKEGSPHASGRYSSVHEEGTAYQAVGRPR